MCVCFIFCVSTITKSKPSVLVSNLPVCEKHFFSHDMLINEDYSVVTPNQNMTQAPTGSFWKCNKWCVESFWIFVYKWRNNRQRCSNMQNMHSLCEASLDQGQPEGTDLVELLRSTQGRHTDMSHAAQLCAASLLLPHTKQMEKGVAMARTAPCLKTASSFTPEVRKTAVRRS